MGARLRVLEWMATGGTEASRIGAPKIPAGAGVIAARETERIASGSRFMLFFCDFTDF